jgi:hypothetical protein
MKPLYTVLAAALLAACGGVFEDPVYVLELPALPPTWAELLPAPAWRFEVLDGEGRYQVLDTGEGFPPALSFSPERAAGILAFPHWPERNLPPGLMRPAGGIFPFDLREDRLVLSWRGGLDAWVYRELAAARRAEGGEQAHSLRRPELFDWPRFRKLWEDAVLPEEVRRDPWLVDWGTFSRKTLRSGFDRRRIVPEPRRELLIPGFGGPWAGTSPFGELLVPEPGGPLRLWVGSGTETLVSGEGLLRYGGKSWLWLPWSAPAGSTLPGPLPIR